jgi:hypothetical protein
MHYNYTTEGRICKAALPVIYVVGSNIVFRFAVFCFFLKKARLTSAAAAHGYSHGGSLFQTVRAVFRRQSAFWEKKLSICALFFGFC